MRLTARKPSPLGLQEGTIVDGYLIEGGMERRGGGELVCEVAGPDGDSASLVLATRPPVDRHGWAQFRRWARVRATLRHPALLPVRVVGEYAGRPYLATDPYPDGTFAGLLDGSPLAPDELLPLLAPVCEALDIAHAQGLVHQGLSSASLLVDGDSLLLDTFGVAVGPPQPTLSAAGVHDIRYAATEELQGQPLQPASNVYSVACLLVHSLTGSPPYEGSTAAQAYGHLVEPPPEPSGRAPGLGSAFDDVIARGMAKDPAKRPASAGELLSEAAAALGVRLPGPPLVFPPGEHVSNGRPAAPSIRPRRATVAAIAAVATAAVGGLVAGVLIWPFDGESSAAAAPSADARALGRLDERRNVLRARLSANDTPQEQAATAAELSDAYGRAGRTADSRPVIAAALAAERAYAELAAAGESGSEERFAAASEAVSSAEGRVAAVAAPRR